MRITCVTIVVVLATALAGAEAGPLDAKRPTPQLRLVSLTPLDVRGSFFRTRERVRLTLTGADLTRTRLLRASRVGSFTAAFQTVYVHPCSSDLSITAAGALGSRASVKVGPPTDCPPPP